MRVPPPRGSLAGLVASQTQTHYRLHIFRDETSDAAPTVRTLEAGATLTLGAEGADIDLGDPFGRAVYAELTAHADALEVKCHSEARGLWVYSLTEAAQSPNTWGSVRSANIDAGVIDPRDEGRLWVRARGELLVFARSRTTKLSAKGTPSAKLGKGGAIFVPGATVLFEQLASSPAKAPAKRAVHASEPMRAIVAHSVLVPLEQRVRTASSEAELETVLEGTSFAASGSALRPLRERVAPEGPWSLPPARFGDAPRTADDVVATLAALGVPPEGTRTTAVYEVPLMLRQRGTNVEPWALLVCAGPEGTERALLYPLVGEAAGLALGRLAAERVARWWHDAPPRLAWHSTELPAWDPWAEAPPIPSWGGIEAQLDTLLEQFPGGRLRPIDRLWRELEKGVATVRTGRGFQHDAVLEAARRLAYLRRDLTVLGLVAHETLRRKLDTLTDERASMRRMPASRVLELVEWSVRALNAGFIGDDNRQKLLNRIAHLLLLFVPSTLEGARRRIVLPGGEAMMLDASAVETHERWVREGAVRRGDKRLFESLAAVSDLIDTAVERLSSHGHAPPEARIAEARGRLDAILATS